jgi:AraC-like DNA-binding protein
MRHSIINGRYMIIESPMSDPLAQIITLLRPSAPQAKLASASGHFRIRREERGQVFYALTLMGRLVLKVDGKAPLTLAAGDFVLIPATQGFTIESPNAPPGLLTQATMLAPGLVRLGDPEAEITTQQLVGHCVFGGPDAALMVRLLPDMVVVRGGERLETLIRLVTDEARADRPGREVVLERLLQVLLIEALRGGPEPCAPPGLLRGLGDARLAPALKAMHADPARAWTVEDLAQMVGLSRSAFFARFERELGRTPMSYLTSWRMSLAKDLLRSGRLGLGEVAARLGYGSASAFSTAFSRETGQSPGLYARTTETVIDEPAL